MSRHPLYDELCGRETIGPVTARERYRGFNGRKLHPMVR